MNKFQKAKINYPYILSIECYSSLVEITWGLSVFNPATDMFEANPLTFAPMRHLAPEVVWGGLYCVTGFLALYFLLTFRVNISRYLHIFAYTIIGSLFFIGLPLGYFWTIYILLAVINLAKLKQDEWKFLPKV